MSALLSVSGLRKSYPGFALAGVDLQVAPGRIVGFIGRNGAGKSTTLKCVMGFARPEGGQVAFFGAPLAGREGAVKARVGFVAGGVDFYTKIRIQRITEATRPFYPNWDEGTYARLMARFDLDARKTPSQLSAGMRVKYALTLALSHRAELLILDEPTSGLDPVSREELLELLLTLARREGVGVLFSTHITSDLDKCADDILYIQAGRIAAAEPLDLFAERYRRVRLSAEQAASCPVRLIGPRPDRQGLSALIRREDEAKCPFPAQRADLERIMVHLEKEADA